MSEKISERLKKNLLELQYQKNLQYFNTTIILLFTYIIGVFIVFITKQIDYRNFNQLILIGIISIAFLSILILLLLKFKNNSNKIISEIKELKI